MPHTFETQPIEVERFYTGVISQRNPLAIPIRIMGRRIIELYDAILAGGDAEISVRSTLQRRAGYLLFNSTVVAGVPLKWFSFEPSSKPGVIFPILDTTTNIWSVPFGVAAPAPTNIFSKPTSTQSSFFAVGNYLYIGNSGFSKKWDSGTFQGLTNWGIAIGSINSAVGPKGCGLGTDVPVPSATPWANPNNITASDGVFSTTTLVPNGSGGSQGPNNCGVGVDLGGGNVAWGTPGAIATGGSATATLAGTATQSNYLQATNFGFAIPSAATILGIVVRYNRSATVAFEIFTNSLLLVKGGSPVGNDEAPNVVWGSTSQGEGGGSPTDLWGTTWTPADINSSNFGFRLRAEQETTGSSTASVFAFPVITVYYSAPAGGTVLSDQLQGTNFGFALPSLNTVSGILVEIQGLQPAGNPAGAFLSVSMLKNGNVTGTAKPNVQLPNANGFISLGGSADLWGTTWGPTDINLTNFGISIQASNPASSNASWSIDFVRITVFGTGGPGATPTGSGTFTATQGYQYVQVFGNSVDANISNPSPPSVSTGPFSNQASVGVNITASTDPQVNQIRLFRTTDTGTGAVFFELPTSPYPNVSATVQDLAPDGALSVTASVQLGSLAFSPPPQGLRLMAWYAGRIWGAVGNLLYFSAGPDNAPMGNGNSDWPPGNVFELPSSIVKLSPLAGGNGMLVTTLNKIHVVQGIQNPGFTVNIWMNDIGARQENAIDSDGSTIYMFTSDRQFLQITSQGINELSQYVSDTTDTFDPTLVYVTQHRSGSQDSRVFLSDGSSRIYPYNLMSSCWETIQTPVDRGGALGTFVENLAGTGVSIPDGNAPNEAAWASPNNATLNTPGTYASATLNAGGSAPNVDSVAIASGQTNSGAPNAVISNTPTKAPEVAFLYLVPSNVPVVSPGAAWTQIGSTGIFWQLLNSASPVNVSESIAGNNAWAGLLALFGSNGSSPVFTSRATGNQTGSFTSGAFVQSSNVGFIVALQMISSSNISQNIYTLTDSNGNTYFKLADVFAQNTNGGFNRSSQVTLWYCPNTTGNASTTLTFNETAGGVATANNWTALEVTNFAGIGPPFSQALDLTNFNFSIPSVDTILGVEVEVFGHQSSLSPDALITANLIQPGGGLSPLGITFQLPASDGEVIAGTPTTGWSLPLTPGILNNSSFGVQLVAKAPNGELVTFSIYAVKIKAFLTNTPVNGVGATASIEVQPGIYKFVKGGTQGGQPLLYRDINTFTDNGLQYSWGAIFGNIPVADPTQLANVDSLVLRMTNAGNLPTVGILPNDISGTFIPLTTQPQFEPPEATAPSPGHRAERYYWSTGTNLWQQLMHFQLQFNFGPSAAQEEILSWGIFPNESADQPTGQIPQVQGR